LVIGILVLIAIILFAFARSIGAADQLAHEVSEPLSIKAVDENIAPIGQVAIAGRDNSALASLGAPKTGVPAADVPKTGEEAYTKVCSSCHAMGIGGAPKIGDHAAWGPRIAQGKPTLYQHAMAGKGAMPPRGGTTWPDPTIRAAVDYMVSLNK
jgi:cytochrome c5